MTRFKKNLLEKIAEKEREKEENAEKKS